MASVTIHHGIRILTLDEGERIADHCGADDIAIVKADDGWWTWFVDAEGQAESYDQPFDSLHRALCAARAAAEMMAE
ncbi:hypothetical protein [Noviherbaspirillum galbum]|uniref:Uncharacterized protein n=1 Tax=Noviherbaspirillum galbum TaxID=2709383 RepID=A0A6B3SPI6_9BURK|nr:hypothetical protein [Noviherbaspirillum galbum]NEX62810.1 hypothetical protein [Noviherbaspirillum galbum]